jgi:hypothetical protein
MQVLHLSVVGGIVLVLLYALERLLSAAACEPLQGLFER